MTAPAAVLRFLAATAPVTTRRAVVWDVRSSGPVSCGAGIGPMATGTGPSRRFHRAALLHREEGAARRGVVSLAGRWRSDDGDRRLLLPLLDLPYGIVAPNTLLPAEPTAASEALGLDPDVVAAAGSVQIPPGEVPGSLLASMPRLQALVDALRRAGVAVDRVGGVAADDVADGEELWLAVGTCCYLDLAPNGPPTVERLEAWARRDVVGTAFAAMYGPGVEPAVVDVDDLAPGEPRSSLPLTPAQRAAVLTARRQQVSVVSGGPGTGKSHAAVAIALDAVSRGESVLLATRSTHAADVLAGLLDRHPGPTPVRFGGDATRRQLADALAAGLPPPPANRELDTAHAAVVDALRAVGRSRATLRALLGVAVDATTHGDDAAAEAVLRVDVPGAFGGDADLAAVLDDLATAATVGGPLARLRAAWAERRARRALGAGRSVPLDRLVEAAERARARRVADAVERAGGLDLGPAWAEHVAAEQRLREAVGAQLQLEVHDRVGRAGRAAAAGLAAALRTGAHRRAVALSRLDGEALTAALPLWVGTVTEVEKLLPPTPGGFDLVVLDEASQLDQLAAAPVLCRAERAVVLGDPQQLRHVSFVADAEVDRALAQHHVGPLAARLDVRRTSAFDAAAAVAPVRWLDEHLRSVPHLVDFNARRFYAGRMHVATRHPAVESRDVIDTVHVGDRSVEGVLVDEVEEVLARVQELAGAPGEAPSVGVVTPFRAQADALEAALLDALDEHAIERLDLRVGTVHAFQGGERDVVLCSPGLVEDDVPQRRRFAEDPHLCNVMTSRARRRMVVVTALPVGTGGLLGAYLDHAERPPLPVEPTPPRDPWTLAVHDELRRNGLEVRAGYPVGPWTVDLCVGEGADAVAVLTRPHPDGVDSEVERRRALDRAGWRVLEAYRTASSADVVDVVLRVRAAVA